MKTIDSKVELKILVTGLDNRDPWIRSQIWAETDEDDFGLLHTQEIRRRIAYLNQQGKSTGKSADFMHDPTLSAEALTFLKIPNYKREAASLFTRQRVDVLLDNLKQLRKARVLFNGLQQITSMAKDGANDAETFAEVMDLFDTTRQDIMDQRGQETWQVGQGTTEEDAVQLVRDMTDPNTMKSISTGLRGLDQHIGGFAPGDLVVLSASPSGGKSALAGQMAINMYLKNHDVAWFSLEMTKDQLKERIVANILKEPFNKIRRKRELDNKEFRDKFFHEWHKFSTEYGQKNNCKIKIFDIKDPRYTPDKLVLSLAGVHYDVIIVDYLTKFYSKQKELWLAQKDHASYLKSLAKRLGCVVIALTQLSDDDKVKYGRGPEEEADWWLWWRYGDEERETGKVDLRLAKARHAPKCFIPSDFMLKYMRIDTQPPKPTLSVYTPKSGKKTEWSNEEFGK